MDKRYQVFLSSTFRDLEVERLEVMRALLELDCFPCGMEYFPAANEDQWSFIKDLIDQCDYYIVVIGGRYGSVDEAGISFTEKEYRYAVDKGIPVIGFTHADPESIPQGKSEQDTPARAKLEGFKQLVQSRLCKEWISASDLGAVVSRSLTQLIRRNPRPGWVRATHLSSAEASEEIIRLRQLSDELKEEVARLSLSKPTGSDSLAQGDDEVELMFVVTLTEPNHTYPRRHHRLSDSELFTWKELLSSFGPYLLTESKLSNVKGALNRLIRDRVAQSIIEQNPELEFGTVTVSEPSLQLVVVQFTALGYLQLSMSKDEGGKEIRLAALTTLGRHELMKAIAVRRGVRAVAASEASEHAEVVLGDSDDQH
jgi:hypothetical protein